MRTLSRSLSIRLIVVHSLNLVQGFQKLVGQGNSIAVAFRSLDPTLQKTLHKERRSAFPTKDKNRFVKVKTEFSRKNSVLRTIVSGELEDSVVGG